MSAAGQPIAVLGAGSWGTALAMVLARNGNPVRLWSNEAEDITAMRRDYANYRYLPDLPFPKGIEIFDDLEECLKDVRDILMVVPSHVFRLVLQRMQPILGDDVRIVWGTKGVDPNTKEFMHQVLQQELGDMPMAVLSGPSFAKEVAADLPTAVSIASNDDAFAKDLITRFQCPNFIVCQETDMVGVQIGGAVKNVLAIAVGMVDGLGFGANARALLITLGLAEMMRLCEALGGHARTVMSLAGLGDLVLTCTDNQSRNRRFGVAMGQGKNAEAAKSEIGQAVEGLTNVKQVHELAGEQGVSMPISSQMYQILYQGAEPDTIMQQLT